jgi:DNA topoisomerase-1
MYTSLPKELDPLKVTIADAVKLIDAKRKQEAQKLLKAFEEDEELTVLNGRYGPYLAYQGKNYRLPRNMHERAKELTYDECMAIINK